MHINFYHWHNRAEIRTDTPLLKTRWDAAAQFAADLNPEDTCALLRLALFGLTEIDFSKRFSSHMVSMEPTFLPDKNTELLRVMATAALYSKMEKPSIQADAVALGWLSTEFQPSRVDPVSTAFGERAAAYLIDESERMRPACKTGTKNKALEEAMEADEWAGNEEATNLLGHAVGELGVTMARIAEENQFLWWVLSKRSSKLNTRREKITAKDYALAAATEAADRVSTLPPPESVTSLIGEVLTQCSKPSSPAVSLLDFIDDKSATLLADKSLIKGGNELCPISSLIYARRSSSPLDDTNITQLRLPSKIRMSPIEVAVQYYRELVFKNALAAL